MPRTRAPLGRSVAVALGRLYPLKSGCLTLGSTPLTRRLVGEQPFVQPARLRNGARIFVLNDFVGRSTLLFGDVDPKVTSVLLRVLRPGDCMVDVGANIGVVSLYAAKAVGTGGAVHAFEPQPEILELLQASLHENSFPQVHVHPVALSDHDGESLLSIPADNRGAASLEAGWMGDFGALTRTTVRLRDASAYLEGLRLPPIRAMKVDIEGHEERFFIGATSYFENTPPAVIVFEEQHQPVESAPAVRILEKLGYEVYGLPKSRLRVRPQLLATHRNPRFHDLVAIHRGPDYLECKHALRVQE